MDNTIREMMDIASRRGSRYIRGEVGLDELPEKMAELGVFLLEKAKRLGELEGPGKKDELIEVQNKMDDLRKSIFANKILAK